MENRKRNVHLHVMVTVSYTHLHTNSGEGLLFFGNTTIPFVDRFPQNTELYAIMTTRPEDKKQEMKRA